MPTPIMMPAMRQVESKRDSALAGCPPELLLMTQAAAGGSILYASCAEPCCLLAWADDWAWQVSCAGSIV